MMMDKIRRYFECYVHITVCNLKCEYCYVRQFSKNSNEIATFKYSPEHISKALSLRRLGGVCYFNVCGAGETMMMPDLDLVVSALLNEGHWVSITTNGTYTQGYKKLLERLNSNNCKHLHFAFSFHYLELKRKGWLGRFVENVNRVKDAGCSFVVQMNWYDGYDSVIDEIKDYC
jgi:molybdenum cofactor biosynthesis enzyme MoaA